MRATRALLLGSISSVIGSAHAASTTGAAGHLGPTKGVVAPHETTNERQSRELREISDRLDPSGAKCISNTDGTDRQIVPKRKFDHTHNARWHQGDRLVRRVISPIITYKAYPSDGDQFIRIDVSGDVKRPHELKISVTEIDAYGNFPLDENGRRVYEPSRIQKFVEATIMKVLKEAGENLVAAQLRRVSVVGDVALNAKRVK